MSEQITAVRAIVIDDLDHRFIQYCPVCGLMSIQEYHNHNRVTYSCCNCGADNNVQAEFGDK